MRPHESSIRMPGDQSGTDLHDMPGGAMAGALDEMPRGGMDAAPASGMGTGEADSHGATGAYDHGIAAAPAHSARSRRTIRVMAARADMPAAGAPYDLGPGDMPRAGGPGGHEGMPAGTMDGTGGDERQNVLIELRVPATRAAAHAFDMVAGFSVPGLEIDASYAPVPLGPTGGGTRSLAADDAGGGQTVVVRGTVHPDQIQELEARDDVVKVWKDTPIAPFSTLIEEGAEVGVVSPMQGFSPCPIGTCDCSPGTPKGTIADVAAYLGVDQVWATGIRGDGIVVGVVDGGITAAGRPTSSVDTSNASWPGKLIQHVIGGFPAADWGTTGVAWGWHANMCSTDVMGMAPSARVYDIRVSGGTNTVSNALAGFQWAIDRHRADGTPQILTNSWGIFQQSWDPAYATDPNHPFTRKVVEALNEGILVLFAAGNCGATCPDGRCGPDTGPGHDIWGANGHPRVMTVGAVNKNEQYVGYSSAGPAALDPQKPDFCSITHFTGFFTSDSGTSAATPICAGVVALMKQASPGLTQDQAKAALKSTAKDIGAPGWDPFAGAGIIRAKAALDVVAAAPRTSGPVVSWAPNRLDVFVIGTTSGLHHKYYNGSAWGPSLTGYEFMGGTIQDSAEVVAWGPNRLDAFVVGMNSGLYHKYWNGAAWGPSVTGYEFLGGVIEGHPRAVAWGSNRLDVFVVGTDRALYHKYWNGSAWAPSVTGYENLGGTIVGSPEVVAWGPNRLDIFVLGTNSGLYHKYWSGSAWGPSVTGYEFLGGVIEEQPKAVAWGANRLDLFVVGTDRALYHKYWNGSAWGPSVTGYENLGGTIQGSPEVVAWGPNRLDLFVVGTDHALYHKWWNGSAWGPSVTGWENLGGTVRGQPHVVSWGANRLDVFVTGMDSALYHKWWNGSAWGPSVTGYENMGGVLSEF